MNVIRTSRNLPVYVLPPKLNTTWLSESMPSVPEVGHCRLNEMGWQSTPISLFLYQSVCGTHANVSWGHCPCDSRRGFGEHNPPKSAIRKMS